MPFARLWLERLAGGSLSEVLLVRRIYNEATERFAQLARPFAKNAQGEACEGSARWTPEEFTTIRVQSRTRRGRSASIVTCLIVPMSRRGA